MSGRRGCPTSRSADGRWPACSARSPGRPSARSGTPSPTSRTWRHSSARSPERSVTPTIEGSVSEGHPPAKPACVACCRVAGLPRCGFAQQGPPAHKGSSSAQKHLILAVPHSQDHSQVFEQLVQFGCAPLLTPLGELLLKENGHKGVEEQPIGDG